jgi:uncharacterized protein YkwD/uncharacterized membrane protein required for colicin V production
MFGLNYVDLLIILALILYTASQARYGFFALVQKFLAFIVAIVASFQLYRPLSELVVSRFDILPGVADAGSFIIIFLISQAAVYYLIERVLFLIPENWRESRWSKIAGIVPAFVDGLIAISLILFILVVVPAFTDIKDDISNSELGGPLVEAISGIEYYLVEVFGGAAQESLTFLTVLPESDETIEIPYRATDLTVDFEAEEEMLRLVNAERLKAGAGLLELDMTIVPVSRDHSRDMWERNYFSHTNPDEESPFDRMDEGGVEYVAAGENLALARTVAQAHQGLMNSPGHRRNILDANFTRIGIGVIDGGIYGKMFTQNFAR